MTIATNEYFLVHYLMIMSLVERSFPNISWQLFILYFLYIEVHGDFSLWELTVQLTVNWLSQVGYDMDDFGICPEHREVFMCYIDCLLFHQAWFTANARVIRA